MDLKNIWSCVIISAFVTSCHAYWWSPASSTEAPVKHIPLGYFRTYTYQPVGAPSPLSFSILGTAINPFSWAPRVPTAPILSGPRYELIPHPTSTEQSKPPLRPPTTTSTTTTTTTTTSTEPPSPPPPPLSSQPPQDRVPIPLINSQNSLNFGTRYLDQASGGGFPQYYGGAAAGGGGLYNRRSLPYFQQPPSLLRPYPYPDYSASNQKPNVQFVPCMCPINLAQLPNDMAETRTIPEGDEMSIPKSTDSPNENENSLDDGVVDREDDDTNQKSL